MVSSPQVSLPSSSSTVSTSFGFELAGDYAFYDKNSNPSVNPKYYQHIISSAKKIVIWDPHFMENVDGELFEDVKNKDVEIEILTVCSSFPSKQIEQHVGQLRDNIKNVLNKSGITNYNGNIFAFKHNKVYDWKGDYLYICHDRFLIVDDSMAYLVGASMNNQVSTDKSFGIMRIDKNNNYDVFKLIVDKYTWLKSKFLSTKNGWRTAIKP